MEGVKIDQKSEKATVSTSLGPARRSERTPGEEKKRWGPRSQAGNLELAIRDGARDWWTAWHALLSSWEAADLNAFAHSAGTRNELQSLK